MTNAALRGKPDAGSPHVRFDEMEVASADFTLMFGAGATLSVAALTIGESVERLSIESVNNEFPFRVAGALDAATLAKIRLNGKRVVQTKDGRLVRRGFVVCIH